MPVYNAEKFLKESIESILNQKFKNFEFVIIDDGSTDHSWEIINSYKCLDPRIKAYQNQKNLGIVYTRNLGFRLASPDSKYYAIFDSDDISLPNRLKLQYEFLEQHQHYGMIGGQIIIINEDGHPICIKAYPRSYKETCSKLILESPFAQPCVMLRKTAMEKIGFYNSKYLRCEDYELWFRMAKVFTIGNLAVPLIKYRKKNIKHMSPFFKKVMYQTAVIQKKWIFDKKFTNKFAIINLIGELLLLAMPSRIILFLSEQIKYKKPKTLLNLQK
jgi:glycosyltransferase involved in cell wall biosynthesis